MITAIIRWSLNNRLLVLLLTVILIAWGIQAIRDKRSGELSHWIPVTLNIDGQRVRKRFPANVRSEILVNGYHETYRRVHI